MTNIKLAVAGMKCRSCEILLVDSLEEMDCVLGAAASHIEGIVKVNFKGDNSCIDRIKETIRAEGFTVQ